MDVEDSDTIESIQPIYYSNDLKICSCLSAHPTMSRDTKNLSKVIEDESFMERLAREGKLDTFVSFITSLIVFVVVMAVVVGILCYFSRA